MYSWNLYVCLLSGREEKLSFDHAMHKNTHTHTQCERECSRIGTHEEADGWKKSIHSIGIEGKQNCFSIWVMPVT